MADLLICRTCGVQFSTTSIEELNNQCPICLDPRQYVPPTGQSWTTLTQLRSENKHKNLFHAVDAPRTSEAQLLAIRTEPQLAIGQSAYLVRTPQGNVLWDCITYLDDETVEAIREYGGLQAIVISHPHFYSTHVEYRGFCVWADVDGLKRLIVLFIFPWKIRSGLCGKMTVSRNVGQGKHNRSFQISK